MRTRASKVHVLLGDVLSRDALVADLVEPARRRHRLIETVRRHAQGQPRPRVVVPAAQLLSGDEAVEAAGQVAHVAFAADLGRSLNLRFVGLPFISRRQSSRTLTLLSLGGAALSGS